LAFVDRLPGLICSHRSDSAAHDRQTGRRPVAHLVAALLLLLLALPLELGEALGALLGCCQSHLQHIGCRAALR
jgi:hypothetical protein